MTVNQMIYLLQIHADHPLMECGTRDADLQFLKSNGLIRWSLKGNWETTGLGGGLISDWKELV